jgi:transcriptional regulator with XRE-family HTH domain
MTTNRRQPPGAVGGQGDAAQGTPGQRIQRLRTARGLTQDDLAKRISVSKSFLSEIENDHSIPGGEIVLRLADALGTTTDYVLRGAAITSAPDLEPVSIPPELADIADELKLSYRATVALLDARRLVLARRGRPDRKAWGSDDWRKLYDKLKDYLE